jgi:hypothetical protein
MIKKKIDYADSLGREIRERGKKYFSEKDELKGHLDVRTKYL